MILIDFVYKLTSVNSCPVCDSNRHKALNEASPDLLVPSDTTKWQYAQCLKCKSLFLKNPPTVDTIGLAYSSYHTHDVSKILNSISIEKRDLSLFAHLLKVLATSYKVSRGLIPDYSYIRWLSTALMFLPVSCPILDRQSRLIEEFPVISQRYLLDVGPGAGSFLRLAKHNHWNIEGVDLDPVCVKLLTEQGMPCLLGTIEDVLELRGESYYDLITMGNSLEHVFNPKETIKAANKLLKPGGRIWIETPNATSQGFLLFRNLWRGLEAPRHIQVFSGTALERLLLESGFVDVCHKKQISYHGFISYASTFFFKYATKSRFRLFRLRIYLACLCARAIAFLNLPFSEYILITATKQ